MGRSKIEGLTGAAWINGGRCFGTVSKRGALPSGAVKFRVLSYYPENVAGRRCPAWADVKVERINCRMIPDVIQPPYFRLFDAVAFVSLYHDTIMATGRDGRIKAVFGGEANPEAFYFWGERLHGTPVIFVDTEVRLIEWNGSQFVEDGQHRVRRISL